MRFPRLQNGRMAEFDFGGVLEEFLALVPDDTLSRIGHIIEAKSEFDPELVRIRRRRTDLPQIIFEPANGARGRERVLQKCSRKLIVECGAEVKRHAMVRNLPR